MYKIIDKRGTGKTSRLMLLVKENNGVLVCNNPYAMTQKAHTYGLTGFDIISYEDYFEGRYDMGKKCFIDELEGYVRFLGSDFAGYSLTVEE